MQKAFERIHRSNLIGMGVLPLEFKADENVKSLNLSGKEIFSLSLQNLKPKQEIRIEARNEKGESRTFLATIRIDTPKELEYYQHGGILHYVLRQLAGT